MSRVAFLFPGQGAQRAGMGKDFYEVSAVARKVIDEAGEWLGLDLKKLCFEEDERLNQTEYTQAALLTVCLAMEKTLETYGIFPEVTAGLSLGEYCAIETAGALSMKDAVLTVRKRGLLMEEAVPAGVGAMAAVLGMDAAAIQAVIQNREGVWIANDNCPGQLVITGEKTAVEEAGILLKEAGARRVLPLKVSGPFHSPLLNTAGEKLAEVLAPCKLSGLKIPYISNTGRAGDGQNKDQRSSDTADQLSGALEGEYGGAHPGRSWHLHRDRTGENTERFSEKNRPKRCGLLHSDHGRS